jgi:phosphosulfolactate synthase
MAELAWSHLFDDLSQRREKFPRKKGLTMIIDKGHGLATTADILEISPGLIDHWKFTFGTSVFVPAHILRQKLRMLKNQGILIYPGGTLLEAAIVRNKWQEFIKRARALGFSAIEISDGTILLPQELRLKIIRYTLEQGFTAITEVGKKDSAQQHTPKEITEQALQDLEWGASYVIVEARESGKKIGIYDDNGAIQTDIFVTICERMGFQVDRLIWEAPLKNQQSLLIQHFGSNVNLGNIPSTEILALEAMRVGLRFETFSDTVTNVSASRIVDQSKRKEYANETK